MRQRFRHWTGVLLVWLRQIDIIVLISVLAVVLCTWGFISLADEVNEGDTQELDVLVLQWFRSGEDGSDPIGPDWFEDGVRDVTALGSTTVLALVVAICSGFLFITHKPHTAWFIIGAALSGGVLSFFLKDFFDRPRPGEVVSLTGVHTTSFPSAHAQLSAVIYVTLGAVVASLLKSRGRKLYVLSVALLLTGMVGVSRLYLGVHYPSDVLAGWAAGVSWAVLWWLAAKQLRRRHVLERIDADAEG